MRLIPPYPDPETPSEAELKLFDELKRINFPEMVGLHSLNLPQHLYKVMGELDFVLISPQVLLVLEVKGGGVACTEGTWTTMDRWGKSHRLKESPFEQARKGMWSLLQCMVDAGLPKEIKDLTPGYGVIFPDVPFKLQGEEWDLDIVLDRERWELMGVANYLHSLQSYWRNKFLTKPPRVSQGLIDNIINYLRPDFELVPSIEVQANRIETRLTKLTQEQYLRLDIIAHSPRILVEGGAGTGKTFLAMEIARRHKKQGDKVLLICFSPLLAEYLSRQKGISGIDVWSIHGLMREHLKNRPEILRQYYPGMPITDPWFMEKLAPAFETSTRGLADKDKFDVLIVDEAQDILNMAYLGGVENLLKGGFEKGRWRIFFDPFHQGAIYNAVDPDTLLLLTDYGAVTPRLTINCRNTDPIIFQTKLATGEEIATESTGPGPDVTMRFYHDRIMQARMLEEYLDGLLNQGCPQGEITILSPDSYETSGAKLLDGRLKSKIKVLSGNVHSTFPQENITFTTIAEFKGLENRYVALIDIEDLSSPGAMDTLYVGMTRPRVQLWLAMKEDLKDTWNRITIENYKKFEGSDNHE